ncbi:MAG: periplasmic heavy metal sensor [Polyangiaceae bacterium]|nr:periplasmic heavy metal sensor [Polyangiaceae bacterium]MBK8937538.1 periplasmic heavy metal sensor [Polyangiaceae bacterium]
MFGFLFGTACLVGLIVMIKRARHGRWGHGYHGRGFGRRGMLNRLFYRLETSPSQEKAIMSAFQEVELAVGALRPELEATRADVASVLKEETFDEGRLGAAFARHDEAFRRVQTAIGGALAKVHGALDREQRERLATLVERRMFGRFGRARGPYREAVHI